ncbi:MAG: TetR/AcrR family transcriptional regulator [Bacillota bacterium]|nr:TetR/AcrR family transcriptional regulator [Bacillota bacterium]
MALVESRKKEVGSKREQILFAAIDMFLDKDYYQVTINEVAERAGVGKGTVYEYFPSKEQLFKECFSYCAESYLQIFRKPRANSIPVKEVMSDIVMTHRELLKENRQRLHLLFNEKPLNFEELQSWMLEKRRELLEGMMLLIQTGIARDEVRGNVDVEMAARLFLSLNFVVIGGMIVLENVEILDSQVSGLFEIYWNGIKK